MLARNGIYPKVFHELLTRGVALAPGAYEVLFPSLAHSAEDLAQTFDACAAAAKAVMAG
ncbi:unannotated protein [freshwater metagenome]|uniref:Unannotated protein n=1 Tax=freshwater metagenome TaxID=449393 RepID=A0A6J6V4P6_9ZZZZ